MSIEAMIEEIRTLPVYERKRLIRLIVDTLPDDGEQDSAKRHSILELAGLGKDIWDGVDAQVYIDELRDEWDEGGQS